MQRRNVKPPSGQTPRPSLLALRAFEAAARHGSFCRAGGELSVTPAAISHQVRSLEEQLGYALFIRRPRQVTLTNEGRTLMLAVAQAFGVIDAALRSNSGPTKGEWLSVGMPPSLAVKWLVPRLHEFRQAYPGIEVRLSATDQLVSPGYDGVDLCIRYGEGDYHGYEVELLLDEEVFPVCSPALLEGQSLRACEDLHRHTLLHDDMFASHAQRLGWGHWAEHFGLTLDVCAGLHFSHACHAIDAAIAGQGVALGHHFLVSDDLQRGRLVRPLDVAHPSPFSYYLVLPRGPRSDFVEAFVGWLKAQIVGTQQNRSAQDSR